MSEQDVSGIAEKLAGLRAVYRDRVRADLQTVQSVEKRVRALLEAPEEDAEGRALTSLVGEMRAIAHRLAGSAGTFGFPEVGGRARVLESALDDVLSAPHTAVDAWLDIRKIINALHDDLARDRGTEQMVAPRQSAPSRRLTDEHRSVRVAVVEDDPHVGGELLLTLQHFGFEVSLYTSLSSARRSLLSSPPEVIVLDHHFEDERQNGADWVQGLQSKLRPFPLLVMISADPSFETMHKAAVVGAQGFFGKPVDVPRLVSRIDQLMVRRQDTPYRVLIVDDDQELAHHFELLLKQEGMMAEVLDRPENLINRLQSLRPDLVLMDVYMPEYSGMELARLIRLHDEWASLPIVYLSAEQDLGRQIEAMSSGADDFITKPISDTHFIAAVKVRARRSRDISEMISRDSMTGLLRHAHIKEDLEHEIARARRSGENLALVMLDLDLFKQVNDTHGHATGDRVIRAVANLLSQRLRKTDRIGRYGGEEFMVILPGCDASQGHSIMDDVREHFEAIPFTGEDGDEFFVTLSAGVTALSDGASGVTGEQLVVTADNALYEAKKNGRNQVHVAGSDGGSVL